MMILCDAYGCTIALVVAAFATIWWLRRKRGVYPTSPNSLFENVKNMQNQKGVHKVKYILGMSRTFKQGDLGRNKYGVTFRYAFPSLTPFFYTTDYKLARLYMQGDSATGSPEFEKGAFTKAMNFTNDNVYSVITHKTSSNERDRAKKALAHAFSSANLQQTWPFIESALITSFEKWQQLAKTGETLDCRSTFLMFFLQILGRSAFGVEITSDGTETETTINGLEYLQAQHKGASERMKAMSLPIRPYVFWSKDVQAGKAACKTLRRIAEKMLHLHRQSPSTAQDGKKRQSIIELIEQHGYANDDARIADINIMTFGGHDTTAFTFCFLLMELARNPTVRAKLQAEIATVMPKQPLGSNSKGKVQQEGEGSSADGTQQLQHGDQKLLSAICGLEYLNCCIKESMRMWPVIPNGSIRQVPEDLHYDGLVIPKGSAIRAHMISMYRESWIDQPDRFLPERWSDSNPQLPQLKEMFMPFSVGRRACIGQNMAIFQQRLIAAYFVHNFDFELVGEPDFELFITLKPVDLLLSLKKRTV